jgi:hypothetical protein
MVLRDRLGRYLVGLNVKRGAVLRGLGLAHPPEGLSDELDIVGAGVEVLVGEVEVDPRGVGCGSTNSTGSGGNRIPEVVWRIPATAAPQ